MNEKMNSNTVKNDKSIIKVDGNLKRNEIELVRNQYLEDRNKLFQETKSGILRELINNDYRGLSEKLIFKVGIKMVQEYLFKDEIKKTGNKEKYADGIFGPATFRKLIDFQKENGLKVDGIAGTSVLYTIAKLDESNPIINNLEKTKNNVIEKKEKTEKNKLEDDIDSSKIDKILQSDVKDKTKEIKIEDDIDSSKIDKILQSDVKDKTKEIKLEDNIYNNKINTKNDSVLTKLEIKKIKYFSDRFKKFDSFVKKLDLKNSNDFKTLFSYVNQFVNNIILYKSDLENYGKSEYWATTKETISRLTGDCEDFALLKKEILIKYGVDEKKLKFLYAKTKEGINHLVLSYDFNDGNEPLILDNVYNGPNSSELDNRFSFNAYDIGRKLKTSDLKYRGLIEKLDKYSFNNDDGKILDTLI